MNNRTRSTSQREFEIVGKKNNQKSEGASVVYSHPDITEIVEYIKNKFYFVTLNANKDFPKGSPTIHFFTTDNELIYNNFYNDFGPLNLACVYKYCWQVNHKLNSSAFKNKQIIHYTSQNDQKRANAAFLVTCYAILYLKKSPKEAYKTLVTGSELSLKPFQDASMGTSIHNIFLPDCLNAIHKAAAFGFFDFEDFDVEEFDKYDQMKNGDLNWMVPQKFLAFLGPSTEIGTVYHPPECYINYFIKNNVIAVVRLNKKTYDAARFRKAGIMHYDMFLPDGSVPSRRILSQFLQLAENTNGPIAVHCKAGLGRTGSLIAAYLIKHYKMTAREAIAWIRICRPGSVIGHQQTWLENMENSLWKAGQQYREKYHGNGDMILHHRRGIYSIADKVERHIQFEKDFQCSKNQCGNYYHLCLYEQFNEPNFEKINKRKLARIFAKLRNLHVSSEETSREQDNRELRTESAIKISLKENQPMTQGDRLNVIKLKRERKTGANNPAISTSKQTAKKNQSSANHNANKTIYKTN